MGKHLLGAFVILSVVMGIWYGGKHSGVEEVQKEWNKAKVEYTLQVSTLELKYAALEAQNQQKTEEFEKQLEDVQQNNKEKLATTEREYAARLSKSQQRADYYQRQAQSSPSEQVLLADHAAKLDRAVEDGRRVVKILRDTLEQRDNELTIVGQKLLEDRKLLETQ